MASYNRDTEVELKGTFEDSNGALVDPDEVELEVLAPGTAVATYKLSLFEVTRVSQGVYTKAVLFDKTGAWYYRFKGTGTVKVANWKRLDVVDDPLG